MLVLFKLFKFNIGIILFSFNIVAIVYYDISFTALFKYKSDEINCRINQVKFYNKGYKVIIHSLMFKKIIKLTLDLLFVILVTIIYSKSVSAIVLLVQFIIFHLIYLHIIFAYYHNQNSMMNKSRLLYYVVLYANELLYISLISAFTLSEYSLNIKVLLSMQLVVLLVTLFLLRGDLSEKYKNV